ncbi:MAG: group 1 truncated hemoglobin [Polyangiaceae bacterium]
MRLRTAAVLFSFVTLSAPLGLVACGPKKPPKQVEPATTEMSSDAGVDAEVDAAATAPQTLYDRLGGKDGVAAVIDSLIKNVSADPDIKKFFAKDTGPKLDHFKQMLNDQICEAAGGPCKYAGKDMKTAHAGMKINDAQWDAFVKDFTLATAENKVGDKELGELLAIVAPMHDDIVVAKKK